MEPVGYIIDLAERIGFIKAVKDKLVRHPEPAAEKLAAALLELRKIFRAGPWAVHVPGTFALRIARSSRTKAGTRCPYSTTGRRTPH